MFNLCEECEGEHTTENCPFIPHTYKMKDGRVNIASGEDRPLAMEGEENAQCMV